MELGGPLPQRVQARCRFGSQTLLQMDLPHTNFGEQSAKILDKFQIGSHLLVLFA